MSEQTEPIEAAEAPTPTPTTTAAEPAPVATARAAVPTARRTVTVPALPLAIVSGIVIAALFLGGGVAIGVAIGPHNGRPGNVQQFGQRENGARGGGMRHSGATNGNGFGQNQQNQQNQQSPQIQPDGPTDRSTVAPKNG